MIRGCKVRLLPTQEQEQLIQKHINGCRFVWNYMLNLQNERYKNKEKYLHHYDMNYLLKDLRNNEFPWLSEISCSSIQLRCKDLDNAFQLFFSKRAGYPKFKSKKKSKESYPVRQSTLYFDGTVVNIEKIGKIKYQTNYELPLTKKYKFYDVRISKTNDKWILSFSVDRENQAVELNDKKIGIDLGVKELAVVAYGNQEFVFHNINKSNYVKQIERKLKHIQRNISRKYESNGHNYNTNNVKNEQRKAAKLYLRLSNIRSNYIHQTTHTIVSMNPCRITVEDLNVCGMIKSNRISKQTQDQCLSTFLEQIKYKAEERNIEFVKADKFFPSSKICSGCGSIVEHLSLKQRTYICKECGLTIDRDYNAAINLQRYIA